MTLSETSGPEVTAVRPGGPKSATKPSRDLALDGLRGIAILMVFLFHYGGGLQSQNPFVRVFGYITQTGWTGIILFFALSGFLITGIIWDSAGEKHLLLNFYARRVLRILPLYLAVLILATIFAIARGSRFGEIKPMFLYLFFLQNFPYLRAYALEMPQPLPLYHLWSLAVEEQFYLIWPLILYIADSRRSARRSAFAVVVISIVFCIIIWEVPAFAYCRYQELFDTFVLPYGSALGLGGALALALRSRNRTGRIGKPRRLVQQYAKHAFWTGIVIYLLVSWYSRSFLLVANYIPNSLQYVVSLPALAIAACALISLVIRHGLPRSFFSLAPLAWLGRISYSFYVFHILLQPLFDFLAIRLTADWHGNVYQTVRLLVAFPITVIVSWLSYQFFELPFLRMKKHFPMRKAVPEG